MTAHSDCFAHGCVIYEMVERKLLFDVNPAESRQNDAEFCRAAAERGDMGMSGTVHPVRPDQESPGHGGVQRAILHHVDWSTWRVRGI